MRRAYRRSQWPTDLAASARHEHRVRWADRPAGAAAAETMPPLDAELKSNRARTARSLALLAREIRRCVGDARGRHRRQAQPPDRSARLPAQLWPIQSG